MACTRALEKVLGNPVGTGVVKIFAANPNEYNDLNMYSGRRYTYFERRHTYFFSSLLSGGVILISGGFMLISGGVILI